VTALGAAVGYYADLYEDSLPMNADPRTPSTEVGTRYLGPLKAYPKSVQTASRGVSWALGADAATFSATVGLVQATRDGFTFKAPRVVEVRVDGRLRLRRSLKVDDVLPVVLDVRGARTVSVTTPPNVWGIDDVTPAALVVGTPMVTSRALAQRNVDTDTALSELRPSSTTRRVSVRTIGTSYASSHDQVGLLGGSLNAGAHGDQGVIGEVTYDLAGRYRTLTGTPVLDGNVGYTPDAETGPVQPKGRIEVRGDGRLLADLSAPISSAAVSPVQRVDVTGVRSLSIRFISEVKGPVGSIALGDPRLT